jgi:hypothetical protein
LKEVAHGASPLRSALVTNIIKVQTTEDLCTVFALLNSSPVLPHLSVQPEENIFPRKADGRVKSETAQPPTTLTQPLKPNGDYTGTMGLILRTNLS